MRFFIVFLFFIQISSCQSNEKDLKELLYLDLVDSIVSKYEDDNPISINIQSRIKLPKEFTAPGALKSQILDVDIHNDTLIVAQIKKKKEINKVRFLNKSDDSMIPKACGLCKKKYFINIYEPLDYWLNYYFVKLNNDEYHPITFEDVYIPVKFSELDMNSGKSEVEVKIYVYDINGNTPELKYILDK